ncbi:MAG: SUKH-4 family immunity protein [Acetatifactor sp.]|nr:SUKH-4 family immunity protein [Acetatifactor sp.]
MNIYEYMEEIFGLMIYEKYRDSKNPVDVISSSGYTVIGNDYGTDICIDSKGEVISLDPERELPTRFINRDLEAFLKFLGIFTAYYMKACEADEEEQIRILEEVKEEFNKVDSRALDYEDNWWSVILEQIEMGLM